MANWFDSITKTLADEKLGRRQALKTIAGTVAGAAVAAYLPGSAFAKKRHHGCPKPGNCLGSPFVNCGGNTNCFCFTRLDNGKGSCGCNEYCSTATPCSGNTCPKGYTCITSTGCGCSSGICSQNCTKTCVLAASRSGRTAA